METLQKLKELTQKQLEKDFKNEVTMENTSNKKQRIAKINCLILEAMVKIHDLANAPSLTYEEQGDLMAAYKRCTVALVNLNDARRGSSV